MQGICFHLQIKSRFITLRQTTLDLQSNNIWNFMRSKIGVDVAGKCNLSKMKIIKPNKNMLSHFAITTEAKISNKKFFKKEPVNYFNLVTKKVRALISVTDENMRFKYRQQSGFKGRKAHYSKDGK